MIKPSLLIISFCMLASVLYSHDIGEPLQTVSLSFYSEQFDVQFDPDIVQSRPFQLNETSINTFYRELSQKNCKAFLNSLAQIKTTYQLNDWLYFELMMQSLEQLYPHNAEADRNLCAWVLLSEAGYDARIGFVNDKVYVYGRITEAIFDAPIINIGDLKFANLSAMYQHEGKQDAALHFPAFKPQAAGICFSFALEHLPKLKADIRTREINFSYNAEKYSLSLQLDNTLYEIMKSYPIIDEHKYLQVPMSSTLSASLLPQLQKILEGKSEKEQIQVLVSFTRSAFMYKEDRAHLGKNKPMIAEEVFHYEFSDCEDRSALFYRLVNDLLGLPMIVLAYQDHLTVAVALNQYNGRAIVHKGKKYYVCDPTGPSNSNEIGLIPKGYEHRSYNILSL